jgi:hypothetical protein
MWWLPRHIILSSLGRPSTAHNAPARHVTEPAIHMVYSTDPITRLRQHKVVDMRLTTVSSSLRLWKFARLWDLLALLLGATTSTILMLSQQYTSLDWGVELGLVVLLFCLFALLSYGIGMLTSTLWQRIANTPAHRARSVGPSRISAVALRLWARLLLIVLILDGIWMLFPVAWSGLRCIENMCTSARAVPLHTNTFLPYEVRDTLTIILWLLVYGIVLPLGSSLVVRLCITPRWLDHRTTIYWVGCGLLLNIGLLSTFPLVNWLSTWYE